MVGDGALSRGPARSSSPNLDGRRRCDCIRTCNGIPIDVSWRPGLVLPKRAARIIRQQVNNGEPNAGAVNRVGSAWIELAVRCRSSIRHGWCSSQSHGVGLFRRAPSPWVCSIRPELAGLFSRSGAVVIRPDMLGWVAIFAPLTLLMLVSLALPPRSLRAVLVVYWAVTALMGVSLSLLLFRYTGASVARISSSPPPRSVRWSLYGYTHQKR